MDATVRTNMERSTLISSVSLYRIFSCTAPSLSVLIPPGIAAPSTIFANFTGFGDEKYHLDGKFSTGRKLIEYRSKSLTLFNGFDWSGFLLDRLRCGAVATSLCSGLWWFYSCFVAPSLSCIRERSRNRFTREQSAVSMKWPLQLLCSKVGAFWTAVRSLEKKISI